ncbi:unnamed protein product [Pseudo-nitzschia multistriata]|uniref:Uncharacterized protein n=1 Tax=Pseudo-nitzschia multistriata TaxID=183589 RepID=A0A448ZL03_9STRA|nr:unnamed protein product [Pseudo-nitzschia multistriata]
MKQKHLSHLLCTMYFYVDTKSWAYQKRCLTYPIQSSAVATILFSAIDIFQGVPLQNVMNPRSLGTYFGGIYCYHAIQCPMEAIHGRPSLWHNILSGGTIGFLGVATGRLGIPLVSPAHAYRYGVSPPVLAFGVYGSISGVMAGMLGSKPF